ncbi:hypothetical protein ACFQL4_27175 [Halosimplex aquaticum]
MSGGPSNGSSGGDDADVETLRIAREEARKTLDAQLSTLDDIDAKALSVFRLDVAIVGVLLSALSFAAASDAAAVSSCSTRRSGSASDCSSSRRPRRG